RLPASAQAVRDVVFDREDPGLRVDHEHDDVGFFDRGLGLTPDSRLDLARAVVEAAGVHKRELATPPLNGRVKTIPRGPRLVLDDGDTVTDQAIEEGRLSDVRSAHDGDEITPHPHTLRRRVARGATERGSRRDSRSALRCGRR